MTLNILIDPVTETEVDRIRNPSIKELRKWIKARTNNVGRPLARVIVNDRAVKVIQAGEENPEEDPL